MPTTSSFSLTLIPLTPVAVRPIILISVSLNLTALPFLVARIICLESSVILTVINLSSSFKPKAIIPPLRGLEK